MTRALTAKQQEALQAVGDRRVSGHCIRGRWRWLDTKRGEEWTAQVEALKDRAFVEMAFYTGGQAGVWLSMAGSVHYDTGVS